jgi:putative Holliday junction resolvase
MRRRVLGVDPGVKRTGLALSDALGISVRPLPTHTPRSRAEDVATLLALVDEHAVEAIVIGLPALPVSGDEGPMAKRARGFALAVANALASLPKDVEVHLLDESGTSIEAAKNLVEAGVKRADRKAALDAESAAILVTRFLEGEVGERVVVVAP